MSAYICSDNQFHALVNYAVREQVRYRVNAACGSVTITRDNAEEIGQILLDENYRSVHHRYQERTEGHFGKAGNYKFKFKKVLPDAITILKAINNLAYQSCETDDWEESLAYKILGEIKDAAIRKLPGYDDAPWGIE